MADVNIINWTSRHVVPLFICFMLYSLSSRCGICQDVFSDFLLCRGCGHEVAKAEHLITRPSKLSHLQRNDTILGIKGVLIQMFENPQGRRFEVITSQTADVYKHEQAYKEDSWFPGYAWRIIVCPRCGAHLGWAFEPGDHTAGKKDTPKTFIGLILDNLLHQDFADELLITPKSYTS